MARRTKKVQHTTVAAYTEEDCWAIVNKDDHISHIATSKYQVKKLYVGSFETLEDDPDEIDEQFEKLLHETDDTLIQVQVNYEIERTRIEK